MQQNLHNLIIASTFTPDPMRYKLWIDLQSDPSGQTWKAVDQDNPTQWVLWSGNQPSPTPTQQYIVDTDDTTWAQISANGQMVPNTIYNVSGSRGYLGSYLAYSAIGYITLGQAN
jgi:hypothetical protein